MLMGEHTDALLACTPGQQVEKVHFLRGTGRLGTGFALGSVCAQGKVLQKSNYYKQTPIKQQHFNHSYIFTVV